MNVPTTSHKTSVLTGLFFAVSGFYLYRFFVTPFEPYSALGDDTPTRFAFFSYLLLPEVYFSSWFGSSETVALNSIITAAGERIPLVFFTLCCLAAATGWGLFFLTVTGIARRFSFEDVGLFSAVAGLGIVSTLMLSSGCLGQLCDTPTILNVTGWTILVFGIFCLVYFYRKSVRPAKGTEVPERKAQNISFRKKAAFFGVLPLFTLLLFLGGMIPSTDYDVLSYHLAGAREFVETGCITFLPHNVYANMPFGAEMFYVWAMTLMCEPLNGALVGKTLIALTTVLTAAGLYSFGRRFYNETAGTTAMVLYLVTPWTFYTSTTGLVDSVVGMYTFFALYAVLLGVDCRCVFLAGFFAGCAAACKYPAVLYTVFPLFVFVTINGFRQKRAGLTALCFLFAAFWACGFWYIKNFYYTGNPFYPLCWELFGDSSGTWNAAVNERWKYAHSPHGFGIGTLLRDVYRLFLSSPWNAPVTVPLALFAFFSLRHNSTEQAQNNVFSSRFVFYFLSIGFLFFFIVWWFLTHRLERFFVPALPILTLFAGIGTASLCYTGSPKRTGFCKSCLTVLLAVSCVYGFIVCGSPAPGKMNRFLAPLDSIRQDTNVSTPWAVWFNAHKPSGKILLIGEAKAFLYESPVLYSVCWNEPILKDIGDSADPKEEFRKRNIEYILVDWSEIQRFRSPGNYGFSEFVQPNIFDDFVRNGILERVPPPTEETEKTFTAVYKVLR